jgi:hypothetical protein
MLLPFYRCCSTPCHHPKPTLQDCWALAFCYYPKTVRVVEFIATVLAYFVAVFVLWAITFILFALDVDPWYG